MTDDDLERYAFSEAEREASEREMAERAAAARSAEMRAWAERRAVDRPEPAVQAPPPDFTAEWQSYITNKVARSEERMLKACMTAVGKALVEQRKELKAEFDAEFDEATRRIPAGPTGSGARKAGADSAARQAPFNCCVMA